MTVSRCLLRSRIRLQPISLVGLPAGYASKHRLIRRNRVYGVRFVRKSLQDKGVLNQFPDRTLASLKHV